MTTFRQLTADYRFPLRLGFTLLFALLLISVGLIMGIARYLQEDIERVSGNYTASVRLLGQIETDINLLRMTLRDGLMSERLDEDSNITGDIDSLASEIRHNMELYRPLETLPEEIALRGSLTRDFDAYLASVEGVITVMSQGRHDEAIDLFQSNVIPRKRLLDNVTQVLTQSNQAASRRVSERLTTLETRYDLLGAIIFIITSVLGYVIYRSVSGQIGRQIASLSEAERQNSILLQEVRERQERITQLLEDMSSRDDDQRRRFARELHDAVGHGLTIALYNLGSARQALPAAAGTGMETASEQLENAMSGLRDALAETKRISYELRPPLLDDFGLGRALTQLAVDFEKRSGIRTTVDVETELPRFDPRVEISLFRVTQEALTNAEKYSGGSGVTVQLIRRDDGTLALSIADNGIGFDPNLQLPADSRLGLKTIAERIELIGGTVIIDSSPGRGTEINVELPSGTIPS